MMILKLQRKYCTVLITTNFIIIVFFNFRFYFFLSQIKIKSFLSCTFVLFSKEFCLQAVLCKLTVNIKVAFIIIIRVML